MMILDADDVLWRQIYDVLRKRIESGEYPEREKIPSLVQLEGEFFPHSRGTIREAIGLLIKQGYIRAIQGKGTFVRPSREWNLAEEA